MNNNMFSLPRAGTRDISRNRSEAEKRYDFEAVLKA